MQNCLACKQPGSHSVGGFGGQCRHDVGPMSKQAYGGRAAARAEQQLVELFAELLSDVAGKGQLRDDVAPSELAAYCLNALAAASSLPTEEAVHRLVGVTVDGLRPHP